MIWSRMLKTSGCAFSISSSRTTEYGLAAHRLGELAALVVADVARRGADQAGDGVPLHELGHVDADQRVLVAEHELGQRPGQLGLATPVGPRKMKEPIGRFGSLSPARARRTALAMVVDGLVLADDPLVQRLLHLQQPLGLLGGDAHHRDAGPHADDLGDVLLGDHRACRARSATPASSVLELLDLRLPAPRGRAARRQPRTAGRRWPLPSRV